MEDNPRKLTHRDKISVLVGYKTDDIGNAHKARIKFDETGKVGYVDIGDLHHFKND